MSGKRFSRGDASGITCVTLGSFLAALLLSGCVASSPTMVPTIATLAPSASPATGERRIDGLPADKVIAVVADAVRDAGAVHTTGTYTMPVLDDAAGDSGTSPDADAARTAVSIDVSGTSTMYAGTLSTDGLDSEWRRLGDDVFVRGSASFASMIGHEQAATGFVRFDASDERITPWTAFLDPVGALSGVLAAPGADVAFGLGSVLAGGGAGVAQLDVTVDGALAGTVTITSEGAPLPSAIAITDATGDGVFTYREWGVDAPPERPDFVVATASAQCESPVERGRSNCNPRGI